VAVCRCFPREGETKIKIQILLILVPTIQSCKLQLKTKKERDKKRQTGYRDLKKHKQNEKRKTKNELRGF
jgi:hypothetical protein